LLPWLGMPIDADTERRLCVDREAGRLYHLDEEDSDIAVQLVADRKLDDLAECCPVRIAIERGGMGANAPIGMFRSSCPAAVTSVMMARYVWKKPCGPLKSSFACPTPPAIS
jgi:hypothetical protein